MNEQGNVQTVIMRQQQMKSGTPVICGSIGFLLGIPAILCATVCAAMCAGVTSAPTLMVASDPTFLSDEKVAEITAASAATTGTLLLPVGVFISFWILGFILCFFGKSDKSKITGILTILCGIVMGIPAVVLVNIMGIAAAVLYIISGGSAMSNANKHDSL